MVSQISKSSYIQALAAQAAVKRGEWNFFHTSPTITLGLRASEADLSHPQAVLEGMGVAVLRTNRGGRVTYHGPGQIVAFPNGNLTDFGLEPRAVREFVDRVFTAIEAFAKANGKPATIAVREGVRAGVWTDASPQARKIASVGLKFSRQGIEHGFSVNLAPSVCKGFELINACGCGVGIAGSLYDRELESDELEALAQDLRNHLSSAGL